MSNYLRYSVEGQERKIEVPPRDLVIGRAPDCNLVITQPGISRHHCKISFDGNAHFIEDLQSKNGTRVNNVYVSRTRLNPGDLIRVAEFLIKYGPSETAGHTSIKRSHSDQMVLISENKELQTEAGTIIRRVNEFQDILKQYDQKRTAEHTVHPREDDSRRIMSVLIEVAKTLISVKNLEEIIESLMNLIFEYLPADRGFLMLLSKDNELVPQVVKHRDPSNSENIEISKTIADKALLEKMAILTTDAQVDPRFSAGDSIRFLGIKSAMCVPLFHKDKTEGLIYLDSPTSAAMFSNNDLDLLTAMANFATVGIEQAQLNKKIQQESFIRQRLARYHSPSIVNKIVQDAVNSDASEDFHLSVQEREVTILFADVVGFTPLAERLPPNRIATLLNEYFSEMTNIIFKYEGTLDKYIGDAIMAIFGAPEHMEDHPFRAVKTAMEMLTQLQVINRSRTMDERFAIRIGINTGRAVAGDIGSVERREYTVLGNTVNLASRIESMACQPNQVVVGERTYMAVRHQFQCETLGPIQLKGIRDKTNVYRILSENP